MKKKEEKYEATKETRKGKDEERFMQSEKESKKKTYRVVFKQNRSFEVKVGRELLRFESHIVNPVFPEKYKQGVPEEIVNHSDFQAQINYFNVMEV